MHGVLRNDVVLGKSNEAAINPDGETARGHEASLCHAICSPRSRVVAEITGYDFQ